jgi:hypothetical protein
MQEEKKPMVGLKNMATDALHDLTHFDTKLFRTLPPLLFQPGKVTQKSLVHGQDDYVKPFALFVFLNFLFFIVKSKGLFHYTLETYRGWFDDRIMAAAADLHISTFILKERFDMAMRFEQKEYFVIMVPLFALVMQLLYWSERRGFGVHMVFALNFYSFLIAFLIIIPYALTPIQWLLDTSGATLNLLYSEDFLIAIILTTCLLYLTVALRRVHHGKFFSTLWRSMVLSGTVLLLITVVYRTLLFFIVMHAISE